MGLVKKSFEDSRERKKQVEIWLKIGRFYVKFGKVGSLQPLIWPLRMSLQPFHQKHIMLCCLECHILHWLQIKSRSISASLLVMTQSTEMFGFRSMEILSNYIYLLASFMIR